MSQVHLQIRPRRVRCERAATPPPFRFEAARAATPKPASPGCRALLLPVRAVALVFALVGRLIDVAFFLVMLTAWCSLHLVLWSYAFDMGPAADCFALPCPAWVTHRVWMACAGLAIITFVLSRLLSRLGHRATSRVLLLLVTFDVAALLLLGINAVA